MLARAQRCLCLLAAASSDKGIGDGRQWYVSGWRDAAGIIYRGHKVAVTMPAAFVQLSFRPSDARHAFSAAARISRAPA